MYADFGRPYNDKGDTRYYAISTVRQEYKPGEQMKGLDFYGNKKYCHKMIDEETALRLRKLKFEEWGEHKPV